MRAHKSHHLKQQGLLKNRVFEKRQITKHLKTKNVFCQTKNWRSNSPALCTFHKRLSYKKDT
jgi:hypothetical protein